MSSRREAPGYATHRGPGEGETRRFCSRCTLFHNAEDLRTRASDRIAPRSDWTWKLALVGACRLLVRAGSIARPGF